MDLSLPILQLRKYCPILASTSGSAELEGVEDNGNLPLPAAYVIPLGQDATPNDTQNAMWQTVTTQFAIVVIFDNRTNNRRGQTAATTSFGQMTTALHAAILNWVIDDSAIRGCQFVKSSLMKQQADRAWYQWVYSYEQIIDETDGFQITGDPISEIIVTVKDDIVGVVKYESDE